MNNSKNSYEIKLSILMIILLHLLPGIIMLLIAFVFSSPIIGINFPILLSLMLAIGIGFVPMELGIIKYFAWKSNNKIKDVILFKEKTPLKISLPQIIISFIIALFAFLIFAQFERKMWGNIYNFFPDWFRVDRFNVTGMKFLKLTLVLNFLFNGFLGPFVEELYFRSFLLPRMKIFGKFAPLINVTLFSIYHFFSPWEIITRILAVTPYTYSVWKNNNIKIGIVVHCLLNTFACIGTILALLT